MPALCRAVALSKRVQPGPRSWGPHCPQAQALPGTRAGPPPPPGSRCSILVLHIFPGTHQAMNTLHLLHGWAFGPVPPDSFSCFRIVLIQTTGGMYESDLAPREAWGPQWAFPGPSADGFPPGAPNRPLTWFRVHLAHLQDGADVGAVWEPAWRLQTLCESRGAGGDPLGS